MEFPGPKLKKLLYLYFRKELAEPEKTDKNSTLKEFFIVF